VPAGNTEEGQLDSEDGATARWGCIEIRNHDRFEIRRQICGIDRCESCHPAHWRWNVNAAGGDGRRTDTATSNYRILGFLLRTAAMRVSILREITEAY